MTEYIKTTAIWFIAICLLFNMVVYILFRNGFVKETRNEKGELKRNQSIKGILSMVAFAFFVMTFLYLYDLALFAGERGAFFNVLSVNFIMMMLLTAYDSFVIDLLVIGILRPGFLGIPSKMNFEEMKKHVKRTYIVGWIYIIPFTFIPSIVYVLVN